MPPATSTVLYTPRFMLRPYRRKDVTTVHEGVLASQSALAAWLPWAQQYNRSVAAQFVRESAGAWHENRAFDFTIRRNAEPDRHLGSVSIWYVSQSNRVGEVGYWVRSDESSRGVCTEAAARLLRFGFEDLGLHRITLRIAVGNRASERVAEKLRFTLEGKLREEVKVGERWLDHTVWGLLQHEWEAEVSRHRTGI